MEINLEITVSILFDKLPLNIAYKLKGNLIGHTKIKGKHFTAHVKYIPGSISEISNKLTVTVTLCKIL